MNEPSYFQGNLKGNFSLIVFNALVAILIGSKPEERKGNKKHEKFNWHWLSSSSGNGIGPFLSAVRRPSHGGGSAGAASSFFLILY